MMTIKQVVVLLFSLVAISAAIWILVSTRSHTDRTAAAPVAQASPPVWDATASTPGPDPSIDKLWREAPKPKVYPPNHPEGIEP